MPTKPPVTPIASTNFTTGRCGPGAPVAIVLHEYDNAIESLDAEALRPVALANAGCHTSFHYGVSDCIIHQYVADTNTAWSFFGTGSCGPGSWALAGVYPGVNANCYTINIAVVTGFLGLNGHYEPNPNNYSTETLRCLANLVCAIAAQYNIAPDATHIWRHGNELADMPFTAFMQMITSCINAPAAPDPEMTNFCNHVDNLPSGGIANDATVLLGADCQLYTLPVGIGGAQTPITANDSSSIDLTTSGTAQHTITAAVKVSPTAGNQLQTIASGLYVPAPTIPAETALTANDSATIDFTANGTANHTLTASVKVSADSGNQVSEHADGIYVPVSTFTQTPLTVTDTPTVDLTASGTDGHALTAAVKISNASGNQLTSDANGLLVPAATVETTLTVVDTATVDLTAGGTHGHALAAAVKISPALGNQLTSDTNGLLVPSLDAAVDALAAGYSCASAFNTGFLSAAGTLAQAHDYTNARIVGASGALAPATDSVLLVTATATIALPAPTLCDRQDFWIVNTNPANTVTLDPTGATTIAGASTLVLSGAGPNTPQQGEAVHIVYASSAWYVL